MMQRRRAPHLSVCVYLAVSGSSTGDASTQMSDRQAGRQREPLERRTVTRHIDPYSLMRRGAHSSGAAASAAGRRIKKKLKCDNENMLLAKEMHANERVRERR